MYVCNLAPLFSELELPLIENKCSIYSCFTDCGSDFSTLLTAYLEIVLQLSVFVIGQVVQGGSDESG